MKKQTIITLTALLAIVVVAMFAGCTEKEVPVSTQIQTSTVTQPVQPAAPMPDRKAPEILSMNSYTDNSGYVKVVGEVKNNLQSNINFVKLTATFYDADKKVIGTDFTYAELDILKPNQKSPFELSSYPNKRTPEWDNYKLHLSYGTTGQSPYPGLEILSHRDKIDNSGYHKIVGEVKNKGERTSSFVKLVSTYYDAKGEVIGTAFTFTDPSDIAPGDSAPFELSSYPRKLRPSSYELQVEGN